MAQLGADHVSGMHERGDCTPTGDNAFLHELELDVKTELTLAETSQPEEADVVPGRHATPGTTTDSSAAGSDPGHGN
jgi:hypothetical protein